VARDLPASATSRRTYVARKIACITQALLIHTGRVEMATKKTADEATRNSADEAAMADGPSGITTTVTFRMPKASADWCKGQASKQGQSFNEFIVELVEDTRGLYVAAGRDLFALEKDREALGVSWREYFQHVFSTRLQQVHEKRPGFDKPGAHEEKPSRR